MSAVSGFGDQRDELADMASGAFDRLGKAAWAAKLCCEDITKEAAKDAERAIANARANLDAVERNLKAKRDYDSRLAALVKS